jgi:peroxiredoxin/uncharacterized membrane protein YphA (DoxX/SURF4 family)
MEIILLLTRLLLAAIFALAGVGKLLDLKGSEKAVKDFGVPKDLAKPFAVALPVAELLIALLLLPASTAWFGAIGAFLLLAVFIGGMIWQMAKGNAPDCHCFGQIHSEPVSPKSLIRNGIFALLAFLLVLNGNQSLSFAELGNELALQLILGLAVIALLSAVVFYLKKMSEQLNQMTRRIEVMEVLSREGTTVEREDLTDPNAGGLLIGSPAPEFVLPNLSGAEISSADLFKQGKPTVLFFVSPTCTPCEELLPYIEVWQHQLKDKVDFVFISSGTPEANIEKIGGDDVFKHVLLQKEREVSELFKAQWTPTALLVNADGAIASHPAAGDTNIRQLIEQIRAEAEVRFITNGDGGGGGGGQKIGEDFPLFSLTDATGKEFNSEQMRGKKTLVTYWSLNCGFCDQMIDELRDWDKTKGADAPDLLLLSQGDAEKNRELNLQGQIVLDDKHEVAQKLGMTGTPSAVLVDERGKIASQIAAGASNIWALLGKKK